MVFGIAVPAVVVEDDDVIRAPDPSLSVFEVYCRSGFNNLNYFIRQFKRIY